MLKRAGIFFILWSAACGPAWAGYSIGFDQSGGAGVTASRVTGSLDLSPGLSPPYQILLSYSQQHFTEGTESRSHQYIVGWSHILEEGIEGHLLLAYWNDTINKIHYAGPSMGITAFWQTPMDSKNSWMEGPPRDILAVSLDTDIYIYGTEISASSTTRVIFDRTVNDYVVAVIPAGTEDAHVTQLYPHMSIDLLWFDLIKPYVLGGHYFYSRDPARLEDIIGIPRFQSAGGQIGGLIGGFLSDTGEVGARIPLPAGFELSGFIGAGRSQTSHDWATVQGAGMQARLFEHFLPRFQWNRSIQAGISSDVYTGGLTYQF